MAKKSDAKSSGGASVASRAGSAAAHARTRTQHRVPEVIPNNAAPDLVTAAFYLRGAIKTLHSPAMKLALAVLVYLIIALILGAGIMMATAGKPLFLIIAFIAFVVAFGKLGCMSH
jgi:hypothetical protein